MSPTASLPPMLLSTLAAVRRRRRALALLQAAAWILSSLSALALLSLLTAEPAVSPLLRGLARSWVVLSVVLPVVLLVRPVWRRTASLLGVARAVDDRVQGTGDSLLTAVDLSQAVAAGRYAQDPEALRLVRVQLAGAERAAEQVQPGELLPWSGLHGSTLVGPAMALVLGVVALLMPGSLPGGLRRLLLSPPPVADDPSLSEEDPVSLTLRNVTVTLRPPAYSGRSELVLEGTSGDLVALPGTEVLIEAEIPGSVQGLSAVMEGQEEPIPGTADDGEGELRFVTGLARRYRVLAERSLGRSPLRSRWFLIEVLPDRPPELEVSGPPGDLSLAEGEEATFNIRASDDFALSRLEQVVRRRGTELHRAPIAAVDGAPSHEAVLRWSPSVLGGEGGELELVIEAWDNDTVQGPKMTSSSPIRIRVPTPADQHRKALALKKQLRERMVDLLADLLVVHATGTRQNRRTEVLADHRRQAGLADQAFAVAGELLDTMRQDTLDKSNSYAGIVQLLENFDHSWSKVVEFAENKVATLRSITVHPVDLGDLQRRRGDALREVEQIILDLGGFIDQQLGEAMRGELANVAEQMAKTQDLLRQAEAGEPVDAAIEEALAELARRMEELSRRLAERSQGPQDGFQNKMPEQASKASMEQVRELVRQGRYEEAMEKLREADDALSRMEEALEEEQQSLAGDGQTAELQAALQEAIDKARALEAQQEAVAGDMEQLAKKMGDPAQDERMEALGPELDALQAQLSELADRDPFSRDPVARAAARAQRSAGQAKESLQTGGLEEAAYATRDVQEEMREAARDATSPEGAKSAKEAAAKADAIADRIEQLQAEKRRSQAQAQRAGQPASERQGGVAEQVEELQRSMEQMGGSAFNPAAARENLGNAGELMRRAQGQLGQGDPQRAGSAARDGLAQLQQFRQSMEAAQQALQSQGSGSPGQQAGRGSPGASQGQGRAPRWDSPQGEQSSGDVELPDGDEFVGPEAYRALLQEGAQGDAPERYKPLNGSYFEELIK